MYKCTDCKNYMRVIFEKENKRIGINRCLVFPSLFKKIAGIFETKESFLFKVKRCNQYVEKEKPKEKS